MHNQEKTIFPQKLWRLINNQRLTPAIRWSDDGQSFFIYENQLKNLCLGKENNVFYTKEPKSFVRQLHLYGFRKVNKNQFVHQFFVRGRPDLLKLIKRSYKQQQQRKQEVDKQQQTPVKVAKIVAKNSSLTSTSTSSSISITSQTTESIVTASTPTMTTTITNIVNCDQQQKEKQNNLFEEIKFDLDDQQSQQQRLLGNQFSGLEDDFVGSSGALLTLTNHYNTCCSSQMDWYDNNMVESVYDYNEDTILNLYDNGIYPNTYEDNNITL